MSNVHELNSQTTLCVQIKMNQFLENSKTF